MVRKQNTYVDMTLLILDLFSSQRRIECECFLVDLDHCTKREIILLDPLVGSTYQSQKKFLIAYGNIFLCNNFKETKLFFTLWQDLCSYYITAAKGFYILSVNFLKFSQVPVRSHSISWTAVVADHRLRPQVPPQSPLCHSTLTVSPISWLCMFVLVMQFQDPNHLSFFATLITKDVVCACFYIML